MNQLNTSFSPAELKKFRKNILAWYDENQRIMPWRAVSPQISNPYHVLLSEIMLQQTQVATVINYFNRFILAFPTVQDLAAADEQEVLNLWQGLGYYRRARNLHAAAKMIVSDFEGIVPDNLPDLLKLPGIGEYCGGAIASIAYSQSVPILDGNVIRLLSRLLAITTAVDQTPTRKLLWSLADQAVPSKRPGDFNQAMMELGALICKPKNPDCNSCPLKNICQARAMEQIDAIPYIAKRTKPKPQDHHILIIAKEDKILMQQRPDKGLWSTMWQMPTWEHPNKKITADDLSLHAKETLGLAVSDWHQLTKFKHQTTHITIQFHLWLAKDILGRLKPNTGKWATHRSIESLPLSNPQRKAVQNAILQAH